MGGDASWSNQRCDLKRICMGRCDRALSWLNDFGLGIEVTHPWTRLKGLKSFKSGVRCSEALLNYLSYLPN